MSATIEGLIFLNKLTEDVHKTRHIRNFICPTVSEFRHIGLGSGLSPVLQAQGYPDCLVSTCFSSISPLMGTDTSPTPDDGIKNHPTQTMAAWATTRMRKVYISQNTEIVVQK